MRGLGKQKQQWVWQQQAPHKEGSAGPGGGWGLPQGRGTEAEKWMVSRESASFFPNVNLHCSLRACGHARRARGRSPASCGPWVSPRGLPGPVLASACHRRGPPAAVSNQKPACSWHCVSVSAYREFAAPFCLFTAVTFPLLCLCFSLRPEAERKSLLFRQRQSVLRGRLPGEFVPRVFPPGRPDQSWGSMRRGWPEKRGGSLWSLSRWEAALHEKGVLTCLL